jgi:DNA-directed RNA polymerase specialized sigma24 family protein
LKFTEVAETAGMSVGTAKATFFQAVRNLRHRIGSLMPGTEREEVGT